MTRILNAVRWLAHAAAISCALVAPSAFAEYPEKPVRIVVPFPAGGSTDIIARAIAEPLGQSLGQSVVIENRPGADGLIAGEAVARAKPDGHTLFLGTATSMSFAPATRKSMPYDPIADFTPIGRVGTFGFFIYVTEGLPAKTLPELVAFAKQNAGQLNHGAATGTGLLASTLFAHSQGISVVQVPYSGDAPLVPDLLTGRIHMAFASGTNLPQVKAGKLRALATLLPTRSPMLPDVPTLKEAGVNPLPIEPWAALYAPAGLPPEIAERLARELRVVLARPDVRAKLSELAFEPVSSTPAELAAFTRLQLQVWRDAARAASVKVE